jgi:hypothetical protein
VRHSVTHAERAGLRVRRYAAGELDPATRTELRALSDEWLAAKGGAAMGFTMVRLSPEGHPSPGARVAVARDAAGRVQAFLTVVPRVPGTRLGESLLNLWCVWGWDWVTWRPWAPAQGSTEPRSRIGWGMLG